MTKRTSDFVSQAEGAGRLLVAENPVEGKLLQPHLLHHMLALLLSQDDSNAARAWRRCRELIAEERAPRKSTAKEIDLDMITAQDNVAVGAGLIECWGDGASREIHGRRILWDEIEFDAGAISREQLTWAGQYVLDLVSAGAGSGELAVLGRLAVVLGPQISMQPLQDLTDAAGVSRTTVMALIDRLTDPARARKAGKPDIAAERARLGVSMIQNHQTTRPKTFTLALTGPIFERRPSKYEERRRQQRELERGAGFVAPVRPEIEDDDDWEGVEPGSAGY